MADVKMSLSDRSSWDFESSSWCHEVTKCKLVITGSLKDMKLVRDDFKTVKKGPWSNMDLFQTIC